MFRVLKAEVHLRTKACKCALAARISCKCRLKGLAMLWHHELLESGERTRKLDIVQVSSIDLLCDRICGQHIIHINEAKYR